MAGVRVHRIVATAFHGEPTDPKHIVDHIDTNCRNNRPENLRWLSRLENALNNPVTRKKIEHLCGSIEAFLENPSILNELQVGASYEWMRTVTKEEAKNCQARMAIWAGKERVSDRPRNSRNNNQSFANRAYKPLQKWEVGLGREPGLEMALTPWCATYMWRAPAYFPCCPESIGLDPVTDYFDNLVVGAVMACSDEKELCPKHTVVEAMIPGGKPGIVVLAERADNKWAVVGIEFDEKSKHFIHYIFGVYKGKADAADKLRSSSSIADYQSAGYGGDMKGM